MNKLLLSPGIVKNPIRTINPRKPNSRVYVLSLQNNKYYVGESINPKKRILDHFNGNGGGWTSMYKPETTCRPLSEPQWELWELTETLKRMNEHGIDNVRGSLFSNPNPLTNIEKVMAAQLFNELNGSCRGCGGSGHFMSQCLSGSGIASWVHKFGGSLHFGQSCDRCGIGIRNKYGNYCE
tara:strand:+ start:400 stop:942 length:543 start_codon:yes stop_codon:yes gene_type:complete